MAGRGAEVEAEALYIVVIKLCEASDDQASFQHKYEGLEIRHPQNPAESGLTTVLQENALI